MKHAFLGMYDHSGLRLLVPEHPDTLKFLYRRLRRDTPGRAGCFWMVASPEVIEAIYRELSEGNRQEALLLLATLSTDCGTLLPEVD